MKPLDNGTLESKWSTNDAGRFAVPALRKVFTLKPGTGGVEFKLLADLSVTQQDDLRASACGGALVDPDTCAQARIDWMRGDKTHEEAAGPLRKRARVLGDIISSSPYYVRDTRTLYIGSNDGMLHAFEADTGNELFAYAPNALMPKLHKLSSPTYSHEYFVDGEIAVSVRSETPGEQEHPRRNPGPGWQGLVCAGCHRPDQLRRFRGAVGVHRGRPGRGAGQAGDRQVEQPGKMAVLVGNGYNSNSERAVLYVIDLETGALIRKIDTQAGSAGDTNGLTTPRGWDDDANGTLDVVYAGDRLGNVWKFDLSSSNPASWGSAFSSAGVPAPFFVARDAGGKRQPITGGMSIGVNPRRGDPNFGKLFVFFGSGQYILSGDITDKSVQTWYGLIDTGTSIPDRTVLMPRTITTESTIGGSAVRAFSTALAGDMAGKRGWYIDLEPPSGANGERITSDAKFLGSVLLVTSIVPSTDMCKPGGDGFLNAVDPFSGGALSTVFFDANRDQAFTDADALMVAGQAGRRGFDQPRQQPAQRGHPDRQPPDHQRHQRPGAQRRRQQSDPHRPHRVARDRAPELK